MDAGVHQFAANIWFFLIGLILMLYVVLDGFDLGVGILSLFVRNEDHRGIMMASLGSVWDGNETWLVLFGGALFGAFPLAYGSILHGLYIPTMAMLFCLIFRGVAFEFREYARRKRPWNLSFGIGSLGAALAQGFALGALIHGLPVDAHQGYVGGVWNWFSGFSCLTAVGVVFGYTLLGATYLVLKTVGDLQRRAYTGAWIAAGLMMAAAVGITAWTPFLYHQVAQRWFTPATFVYFVWLPLLAMFAFAMLVRSLVRRQDGAPFLWSVVIFTASAVGLGASLFPYIVPGYLTLYQAAATTKTLIFMLTGIGMLIPIMLVYNGYQYLVFRGKITASSAYGEEA